MTRRPNLGFCSLALLACACTSLTRPEQAAIDRYLACVECSAGELDSVKALATRKTAALDTLGVVLLAGPALPSRQRAEAQFRASYLQIHNPGLPTGMPDSQYVQHYSENVFVGYRIRAALALKEIGGPAACASLKEARDHPVRPQGDTLRVDVVQAAKELLNQMTC